MTVEWKKYKENKSLPKKLISEPTTGRLNQQRGCDMVELYTNQTWTKWQNAVNIETRGSNSKYN